MELIVIAHPKILKNETLLVNQLFEAGLPIFHLRKPEADEAAHGKFMDGILPEYHNRIALHHFHSLAGDYNINRIHHTERFRKNSTFGDFTQPYTFSTSIHKMAEIDQIDQYHYSFFGPVFNSLSKPGYAGIAHNGFSIDRPKTTKLIALGGIEINNIDQVKAMNFDGIALLGSIWNDPAQALNNFKKIQEKCQHLLTLQQ
ncbi:thiamine phosphate synthase [Pedobacter sp. KBW01]|uniref:thiamine phosphate synthase n=1 Tax=Pedobacter sp. KBW01 TaxID=2153364 RepID=UPI000F592259|nr:thiamine phosphate synthase [Pedobacter sp. KBW01]RQO71018.1 thiamine phosphate synthase [Pedobacter sp. KBW01]